MRPCASIHASAFRPADEETYKAFDTNLRCHVALKVINSAYLNSETAQQRFLREARAAAALRHPNVASVFHASPVPSPSADPPDRSGWGRLSRLDPLDVERIKPD